MSSLYNKVFSNDQYEYMDWAKVENFKPIIVEEYGLRYKILEERERTITIPIERNISAARRIGKIVFGILAVIATLGLALFSPHVRNLFTGKDILQLTSRDVVHFAELVENKDANDIPKFKEPKLKKSKLKKSAQQVESTVTPALKPRPVKSPKNPPQPSELKDEALRHSFFYGRAVLSTEQKQLMGQEIARRPDILNSDRLDPMKFLDLLKYLPSEEEKNKLFSNFSNKKLTLLINDTRFNSKDKSYLSYVSLLSAEAVRTPERMQILKEIHPNIICELLVRLNQEGQQSFLNTQAPKDLISLLKVSADSADSKEICKLILEQLVTKPLNQEWLRSLTTDNVAINLKFFLREMFEKGYIDQADIQRFIAVRKNLSILSLISRTTIYEILITLSPEEQERLLNMLVPEDLIILFSSASKNEELFKLIFEVFLTGLVNQNFIRTIKVTDPLGKTMIEAVNSGIRMGYLDRAETIQRIEDIHKSRMWNPESVILLLECLPSEEEKNKLFSNFSNRNLNSLIMNTNFDFKDKRYLSYVSLLTAEALRTPERMQSLKGIYKNTICNLLVRLNQEGQQSLLDMQTPMDLFLLLQLSLSSKELSKLIFEQLITKPYQEWLRSLTTDIVAINLKFILRQMFEKGYIDQADIQRFIAVRKNLSILSLISPTTIYEILITLSPKEQERLLNMLVPEDLIILFSSSKNNELFKLIYEVFLFGPANQNFIRTIKPTDPLGKTMKKAWERIENLHRAETIQRPEDNRKVTFQVPLTQ